MNNEKIKRLEIVKFRGLNRNETDDILAIEDPVEIKIIHPEVNQGKPNPISITMRTPGDDIDLALGFLFTEGIINSMDQVKSANQLGPNSVWVTLTSNASFDMNSLDRNFYTTSSCGVCGKASIDAIHTTTSFDIHKSKIQVNSKSLSNLQNELLAVQSVFSQTGGIHAAALFDIDGKLAFLREDVGRHNALDKLIGHSFQHDLIPLNNKMLLLSGRASFELLQKAGMAGIAIVLAVGAPSTLAVEVAERLGITLVGFLKSDGFNVYSNPYRII